MRYSYKALLVKQTPESPQIVLTAAPAREIQEWGGIPQKRELEETGTETTGFQREFNKARLASLKSFFENPTNVAQNALLCSSREIPRGGIKFVAETKNESVEFGTLEIEFKGYEGEPLVKYFKDLVDQIEERKPELKQAEVPPHLIKQLKEKANDQIGENADFDENGLEREPTPQEENEIERGLDFEDIHIKEFWEEVKAIYLILKELGDYDKDSFAGYDREALLSFLRPAVIVDGQHRLMGALEAIKGEITKDQYVDEIANRIDEGDDVETVQRDIEISASRILPVSMLLQEDPAEHVFQFVIVNQKATTMSPPLLGTIVSTSLSEEELGRVRSRLEDSGIPLDESQAVSIVSRIEGSPFRGKVQKGLRSDGGKVLSWNVCKTLVSMFRDLKGGKIFHDNKIDWAALWRDDFLEDSKIIEDFEKKGFKTAFEYWNSLEGPWMKVFFRFWSAIRDYFASNDPHSRNYWGDPVVSNLFNKPSLTILAADFFSFLYDKELTIDSVEEIDEHVKRWLKKVTPAYFDQDWQLKNVKKEVPGTMKRWSSLWVPYRKGGGNKPKNTEYRKPLL
jgi:hypothetical protein